MLAHGFNILLFCFWHMITRGASTNQYEHALFTLSGASGKNLYFYRWLPRAQAALALMA